MTISFQTRTKAPSKLKFGDLNLTSSHVVDLPWRALQWLKDISLLLARKILLIK
jgi:hypothetical protein